MSETQKIFASLSGAVAAHVVLLFVVFGLLETRSIGSSLPDPDSGAGPREVTVMLGDLLDEIEPIPEAELPPEPEEPEMEEELETARPFIDTQSNRPEAEAPEDATFESDRNTSAAAELAPDPSQPQREGPTTKGALPIDRLTLQKREYVDGELDRPAAPPGMEAESDVPVEANLEPVGGGFPATTPQTPQEEASASRPPNPESENETGEDEESRVGADRAPEEMVAEERARPEESRTDGVEEESSMRRSFTLPSEDGGTLPKVEEGVEDAFAVEQPETEDPVGEMRDQEELAEAVTGADGEEGEDEAQPREQVDTPPEESSEATEPADTPGMRPADQGIFADGFSPHEMQSTTNGTLSNVGQNAVDAEATAVGKYKMQVRQVIARKWHQYRIENGKHVTWGILKVKCRIDRFGKVHDLRIVENRANTMLADFSLRAIVDAKLPPMPDEVAAELGPKGLEMNYDIIIY